MDMKLIPIGIINSPFTIRMIHQVIADIQIKLVQ